MNGFFNNFTFVDNLIFNLEEIMDVKTLKKFLWKCVVINFIILIFMFPLWLFSDAVYEIHSQWFLGSKVEFAAYIYYVLGFYRRIVLGI